MSCSQGAVSRALPGRFGLDLRSPARILDPMQTPTVPEQPAPSVALWPRKPRPALIAAVLLWVVPMLVVGVMVALRPRHRTVTLDSYHVAAGNWWVGKDLYFGPGGMNYLPQFAILFSPFTACRYGWAKCCGGSAQRPPLPAGSGG